jgi:hypothetical protein
MATRNPRIAVQRLIVKIEPQSTAEKSIVIRLGASLLRQNLFDQLEYRRHVLVLRSGQIEIFLAFFQAVVGIDVVFWNIDAAGIVRVGPAEFLQRDLPFPGQQPVDENFRRIGMGRARGIPSVPPAALLPPPAAWRSV